MVTGALLVSGGCDGDYARFRGPAMNPLLTSSRPRTVETPTPSNLTAASDKTVEDATGSAFSRSTARRNATEPGRTVIDERPAARYGRRGAGSAGTGYLPAMSIAARWLKSMLVPIGLPPPG
ncbi:hypothetical protein GCM10027068_45250 [Prescottella soli]